MLQQKKLEAKNRTTKRLREVVKTSTSLGGLAAGGLAGGAVNALDMDPRIGGYEWPVLQLVGGGVGAVMADGGAAQVARGSWAYAWGRLGEIGVEMAREAISRRRGIPTAAPAPAPAPAPEDEG